MTSDAPPELVIRARRVVTPGGIIPAEVHVRAGKITSVAEIPPAGADPGGSRGESRGSGAGPAAKAGAGSSRGETEVVVLGEDEVLLPGLVDTHVHINEPGRTDWEGFATATAAAAAGGVTTLIDMPLNSVPPTTDVAALEAKRAAAAGQCAVDVGFWGGAVPDNSGERAALHAAGVFGFKCFTVDSGVPEFPPLDEAALAAAMRQLAELDSLLIVHAEDAACIAAAIAGVPGGRLLGPAAAGVPGGRLLGPAAAGVPGGRALGPAAAGAPGGRAPGPAAAGAGLAAPAAPVAGLATPPGGRRYRDFVRSRQARAETAAIGRLIELARATGARVHVLHLSAADAVPLLAQARAGGVRITAETCPHYLTLAAEQVRDGQTQFKCCPPVRDAANRELLWEAVEAGVIGCVVSDHSPCPAELKRLDTGDFGAAWGGISSVQLGLPVVWTKAAQRGHDLTDVSRWMAANPAALAGLAGKGAIAEGRDADLVAFAPDERFVVTPELLLTRHRLTPYLGQELRGVVRTTWLRGERAEQASALAGSSREDDCDDGSVGRPGGPA